MLKVTRWSPDTCGCVIDIEWDTDDPPETRVHRSIGASGCIFHDHHLHGSEDQDEAVRQRAHARHHEAVLSENQFKNLSVGALAAHLSNALGEDVQAHEILWSHGDKRELELDTAKVFGDRPHHAHRRKAAVAASKSLFGDPADDTKKVRVK